MTFDILGESSLDFIRQAPNEEVFLKNLEGITFKAAAVTPSTDLPALLQTELTDPVALNKALEGWCAILPADYWNYEWCHKKEFSQFHIEQGGGNKFIKSPN
eukprot:gene10607-11753_t